MLGKGISIIKLYLVYLVILARDRSNFEVLDLNSLFMCFLVGIIMIIGRGS